MSTMATKCNNSATIKSSLRGSLRGGEKMDKVISTSVIRKCSVIEVIETISIIGNGTSEDPVRYLYEYWDLDGNLLASKDEWK